MTVAERYLELALRIGRHDDEVVEAYRGPGEIEARVAAEEPREPARLRDRADVLLSDLAAADVEPGCRRWLDAQVRALHTLTRRMSSEDLPYVDRLKHWLDATAVPKDVLLPAMSAIATKLRARTRELFGLPDG